MKFSYLNKFTFVLICSGLINSIIFTTAFAQEALKGCAKDTSAECLVLFDKAMDKKNMTEAISWLEKGCGFDNSRACLKLGSYHEKLNNKEKAIEFYKKSCALESKSSCPNAERLSK